MQRAPFDPALLRLLASYASRGLLHPGVALDYASGFSKINNPGRFDPDTHEMEARFERVFRRSDRDARQRIAYLYPDQTADALTDRYLAMFSELATSLRRRGITMIVLKLPIPSYYAALLPREEAFTRRIAGVLAGQAVFADFSQVDNDERFFLDTDHLNRAGVLNFLRTRLGPILLQYRPGTLP